jgi:hypothetical protein
MPVIVGNSTVNTSIAATSVTENTPQGFAVYNATRNTVMPTLRLDFVNSNVLDPRVTFARASDATYFASSGKLTTAATNVPRFDYNPATGVCNGLLIEQASTNLFLQSNFASGWSTTGSPTVTANAATSPDGTTNAVLWTRITTASSYIGQGISKAASALVYTFSVFVKASVGNYVALRTQGTYPARADVVFNLSNGTISTAAVATSTFTGASATIQALSNGWYRVSLTATSDTNTDVQGYISFNTSGGAIDATDSVSNSAGYLYGAQMEQLAFSTSYIATTTGSATRAVDIVTITYTNFSSWYNSSYGTYVINATFQPVPNPNNGVLYGTCDASGFSNTFYAVLNASGSTVFYNGYGVLTASSNVPFKLATRYVYGAPGTTSSSDDGSALNPVNQSWTSPAPPTKLVLGSAPWGPGSSSMTGRIQRFTYYPIAVSNNELISLSS